MSKTFKILASYSSNESIAYGEHKVKQLERKQAKKALNRSRDMARANARTAQVMFSGIAK